VDGGSALKIDGEKYDIDKAQTVVVAKNGKAQ
jgi:hypothetical protein